MENYKTINGTNQYNTKSFNEMCEALESGETIGIYIDCIGHTRAEMEEFNYARELKNKYGDKLLVDDSGWKDTYRLQKED